MKAGNLSFVGVFALVLVLAGCVIEPETGRRRMILTPQSVESSLGVQAWADVKGKEKPTTTSKWSSAVVRVGGAVTKAVDAPGYKWEFECFASEQANAFCLPGGKIAVYDGIFKHMANDAELAAVIGHEIAHATARHGGERMSQGIAVSAGALALGVAVGGQSKEAQERWMLAYGGISNVGLTLPFSRVHEYSADRIGLLYMARAGYNPEAAVHFWQKFAAAKGDASTSDFLSTHPADEKRVAELKKYLPQAMAEYRKAPKRFGFGEKYR
jgi:metalloendopeptidase OMA1, mitochondrial